MSESGNGNNNKVNRKTVKAKGVVKPKAERPKPKAASDAIQHKTDAENKPTSTQPAPAGLPTENMEVHHHPQLEHKPKAWKEYLLEGLMIFIAVMMGFISENIREYISDNEHVNQLTAQLVRDLEADTARLKEDYNGEAKMMRKTDTLFRLLQQPMGKADLRKIQQLIADSHSLWLFKPSGGAMAAIKNELRLKQFSNSKIIGYIANYEGHASLEHTAEEIALQYQRNFTDVFMRQHFTPANLDAAFNHFPVSDQMRDLKQQDLTQLAADLVLIRINIDEMIRHNRSLMDDANGLLHYVIDRYHPEVE
ncbi:hypothetical protein [Mucilaginibacter ginsenosidivorans]|uniref:Uncharacterized protein n=1 Tax=Mucilaginibacter ginsenosidivorans TaxID=398053 RepID=A0A5B8UVS9_9SPHI|nr:hypothetical protein [Mucilaginibacter ginsenosidivorans]QEC62998.1 hypothetical protein FRZ54_10545 [Mucilaginibacter ginsenosidivorans]